MQITYVISVRIGLGLLLGGGQVIPWITGYVLLAISSTVTDLWDFGCKAMSLIYDRNKMVSFALVEVCALVHASLVDTFFTWCVCF